MQLRNTETGFGLVARFLHWLTAIAIIGMFALGLWMRGLSYYDPWYRLGPEWHQSIGILLLVVVLGRLVWRWMNPLPVEPSLSRFEKTASVWTHRLFYLMIVALCGVGYLIPTADGSDLLLFWAIPLPSLVEGKDLADIAGTVHEYIAYALIGLAVIHALAALKHHFIDKDDTLRRMVRAPSSNG